MAYLRCGCCGERAEGGKQHWNQDTGFGLCAKCVHYIAKKNPEELNSYGTPGVNFATPLTRDCKPGMLVSWRSVSDIEGEYRIGKIKEWDNGTAIIKELDGGTVAIAA